MVATTIFILALAASSAAFRLPIIRPRSPLPCTSSELLAASSTSLSAVSSTIVTVAPIAATKTAASGSSSTIAVSRAGGVLNPSAAAEANPVDTTAVKAFSSTTIKSSTGQCLTIDPNAGDFRENLIPITLTACNGNPGQSWDIVTSGKHNNVAGSILIVSTLTQGCLNFDPRRAAGDTVIMFSCGGRADGGGAVTNSQLFPFSAGSRSLALAPENANGATCLAPNGAKLDSTACTKGADQAFTFG